MAKKTGSFIALLLIATTFNAHSMKRANPMRVLPAGTLITLPSGQVLEVIGDILLDSKNVNTLLLTPPFEFTQLPIEVREHIIYLLSLETTATSLKTAALTINSLAQVNKELNTLINNPQFCLQIIKHLSKKFKCSDEETANVLQTQEAKRLIKLQNELKLFCESAPPKTFFDITIKSSVISLASLIEQGVDLNFTYASQFYNTYTTFTPLIHALAKPEVLEQLCAVEKNKLNINQCNLEGNTALIRAINRQLIPSIHILLDAGADPKLANFAGLTPLAAAQDTGNKEIIDLIHNAIKERDAHNKGIDQ